MQRWNDAEQAHAAAVQRYVIHWWDQAPPADWEPTDELGVVNLAGITRLRHAADRARADYETVTLSNMH